MKNQKKQKAMSPKRLLIITNRYPANQDDPASPFVYDFRRGLERLNIEVTVVAPFYVPHRGDVRYIDNAVHLFNWSDGKTVISQLPLYNPLSPVKICRYFRNGFFAAEKLISKEKYTAIISLWALPSGYIARKLSRRFGIPYAVWALGSDINCWAAKPFIGPLIINILKKADKLYADGYELATKVQHLTDKECRFLPSYHAVGFEKPALPSEEKYFISIGRIEKEKGVFDLLEGFRRFSRKHEDWQLYFVGTGQAERKLIGIIQSCHLEKRVKCYGYLERKAVNRLMFLSRAVIIPSLSDSLPLTFGEAMQAGRPVITSDIGDLPFFVDKYKVGYHYPAGDKETLAEKMELMISAGADFSDNCHKVTMELDIANSARVIAEWLDSLVPTDKVPKYQYADA
jgi:glycosyltransferase involved in cell wall biosynthesis